jgi:hypothetical protein
MKFLSKRYGIVIFCPKKYFMLNDIEENVKAAKNNGITVRLFTSQSELIRDLRNQKVWIWQTLE